MKLIIAGGSNFNSNVESKIKIKAKKILGKRYSDVIFTGHLKTLELIQYYKQCNVLAIPSIADEAAGMIALEGSFMGTKIVSSNSDDCLSTYLVTLKL